MSKSITFKHIFIAFLIGTVILCIFAYFDSRRPDKLPFDNKIELKGIWKKSFDHLINPSWVITQDGELYLHSYRTDKLVVNTVDGKTINKINLSKDYYDVKIEKEGDKLYLICNDRDFYIIDQKEKSITDKYLNDRKILYSENIIKHNQYYIFWNRSGKITVLNINTGKIVNKDVNSSIYDSIFATLDDVDVLGDCLYYSKNGFNVYALKINTLDEIWNYDIGHEHAGSNPVIINKEIYLEIDEKILVFDYMSGKIKKEIPKYGFFIFNDENNLYVTGYKYIWKINSNNKKPIWRFEEDTSNLILKKDYIFFESSEEPVFIKINKNTGKLIWRTDLRDFKFDVVKVVSTKKYDIFERDDGIIYVVDSKTGEKLWRFNDAVDNKDLYWDVYKNKLIISDGENKMYSYELK